MPVESKNHYDQFNVTMNCYETLAPHVLYKNKKTKRYQQNSAALKFIL